MMTDGSPMLVNEDNRRKACFDSSIDINMHIDVNEEEELQRSLMNLIVISSEEPLFLCNELNLP